MTEADQKILTVLSLTELCRMCRVERGAIMGLVEYGVLVPEGESERDWVFDQRGIQRAVRACRLEQDLGLNLAGIALVLDLLEERAMLLRRLQAED